VDTLNVSFYVLGALAVLGALSMLLSRQPMRAAVSLLFVMLVLSGMYALLSAPFMAVLQLIIYAGAIMTLIIFIVTLVDVKGDDLHKVFSQITLFAVPAVLGLSVLIILHIMQGIPAAGQPPAEFGSVKNFTRILLSQYALQFELASVLLLVGIVGISALRGKKEESK
jgi:NADH-quinone oxidoreductase subunit J